MQNNSEIKPVLPSNYPKPTEHFITSMHLSDQQNIVVEGQAMQEKPFVLTNALNYPMVDE